MRRHVPKRRALSRCFMKAASKKDVLLIDLSLYSDRINSVACPEGSITRGYLREESHINLINI